MTRPLVDRIADAVLYEGYLLYPYRPSSVKNRQRWTFGGLFPRDSELARSGAEPWALQCECLIEGGCETVVRVRPRFLHLLQRTAGTQVWQEAEDREVVMTSPLPVEQQEHTQLQHLFAVPSRVVRESVRDASGEVVSEIVREQQAIRGAVELTTALVRDQLCRLTVRVENHTPPARVDGTREELLPSALVSTHAILEARNAMFVSQIDPPEQFRETAAECRQVGVWPVLVGEVGERHTVLASPIILYDYPQLAPESPGDLFDATEIDEILTLRILTMTDEEKREMRAADPRADALLTRTEALARDELMRLHGTIRGLRPVSGGGT
jgi:hydrogenase maturation protease